MTTRHITSQFESDEVNRKIVHKSLGTVALIPDELTELYVLHYKAIGDHFPDNVAEVASWLYVGCQKHLVLAVTSLFRCYSTQAFRETRGAIESAGIAHAIRRDSETFRLFKDKLDTREKRKAHRERFKSNVLFSGDILKLKALYDRASELSHTNRRTFGPHLNIRERTFSYQDLHKKDIPKLATNYLLWICAAHLTILEMADFVFPEAHGELVAKFKQERQWLREKIYRFDQQNRSDTYVWNDSY